MLMHCVSFEPGSLVGDLVVLEMSWQPPSPPDRHQLVIDGGPSFGDVD